MLSNHSPRVVCRKGVCGAVMDGSCHVLLTCWCFFEIMHLHILWRNKRVCSSLGGAKVQTAHLEDQHQECFVLEGHCQ